MNKKTEHKQKLRQLILEKTSVNISDSKNSNHFFAKEFERVFSKESYNEYKDRLIYFHYFLNQFEKIKSHNKKDFAGYLNKFMIDGVNLNGEKFEVLTYARLFDMGISFFKPKSSPDFQCEINNVPVFIECNIRQVDQKDFFVESIEKAITNKQEKGIKQGYANPNTALHIDISKSIYNSYGEDDFLSSTKLNEILDSKISSVDFGAIVLLNTFYAKEDGCVYTEPVIRYNKNCSEYIKELHKRIFPVESKKVTPILRQHI